MFSRKSGICYVNSYSRTATQSMLAVRCSSQKKPIPIPHWSHKPETQSPAQHETPRARFQFPSCQLRQFPSFPVAGCVTKLSARLLLFLWQLGSSWVTSNDFLCPPLSSSCPRNAGRPHGATSRDPLAVPCTRCGCKMYVFGGVCVMRC